MESEPYRVSLYEMMLRVCNVLVGGCVMLTGFCGLGMALSDKILSHGSLYAVRVLASLILISSGLTITIIEIFEKAVTPNVPPVLARIANKPISRALVYLLLAALCITVRMIGIGSAIAAFVAGVTNFVVLKRIQRKTLMESVGISTLSDEEHCWRVLSFGKLRQHARRMSEVGQNRLRTNSTSKLTRQNFDNNVETFAVSVEMQSLKKDQNNNFKIVVSEDQLYELNPFQSPTNPTSFGSGLQHIGIDDDICPPLEMSPEMRIRPMDSNNEASPKDSPMSHPRMLSPVSDNNESFNSIHESSESSQDRDAGMPNPREWRIVSDETGEYWFNAVTGKTSWTNPLVHE